MRNIVLYFNHCVVDYSHFSILVLHVSCLVLHLGHLVLHAKKVILNFMCIAMWHIQCYVQYHVTDTQSHKLYCISHVLATQGPPLIFIIYIYRH